MSTSLLLPLLLGLEGFLRWGLPIGNLELPPGFKVAIYAQKVPDARSMTLGDHGTLFVGTRTAGAVYALPDRDGDGEADEVITIAHGLTMPNGVAFHDGALYVAEVNRVVRFDAIEEHLNNPPAPTVLLDNLPGYRHHGWRYLRFGPDGKFYISVGAPCNICDESTETGIIARFNPDGSGYEPYALGVRNSVGFDWQPGSGDLWFTDNGRDMMGDDLPPDELNHATEPGQHFGFPYCHGGDIQDPGYPERPCADFTPPAQRLGAHVAPLGMRFYTGEQFPPEYRNQILIPEHGSWNRSEKSGYRITSVSLEDGKAVEYAPFVTGWLGEDGKAWGRPVDLLVARDGSLLVSDDRANAVYRIYHTGN